MSFSEMSASSEDETYNDQPTNELTLTISQPREKWNCEIYTMDEVEKALNSIDMKYSNYSCQNGRDKDLMMLLQDFDSLGLPEIDPSLPAKDLNRKVVSSTKLLVEMYRRNLNKLDEDNLNFKSKDTKYSDLQKKLTSLKNSYDKLVYKNKSLEAVVDKMKSENSRMNDMLVSQRNEIKKLKMYHSSKQEEMQHSIKKLERSNQDLKTMFRKDVGKYIAKDDVVADYVKKCKLNQQIYESTIKQLQENNNRLMEELTKLRED